MPIKDTLPIDSNHDTINPDIWILMSTNLVTIWFIHPDHQFWEQHQEEEQQQQEV